MIQKIEQLAAFLGPYRKWWRIAALVAFAAFFAVGYFFLRLNAVFVVLSLYSLGAILGWSLVLEALAMFYDPVSGPFVVEKIRQNIPHLSLRVFAYFGRYVVLGVFVPFMMLACLYAPFAMIHEISDITHKLQDAQTHEQSSAGKAGNR